MSLLAPWFLAGLALLAGPIIAHLIRRATRDRVAFSAVRFLTPSAPRLDRRSRIQHPLLLALRLLILALLALAFARPYFTTNTPLVPAVTPPRHVIVILDQSASMRREGLWSAALERVQSIVSDLSSTDDFSLLLADDQVRDLIVAETWRATPPADRESLLNGILETVAAAGWSAFHFDQAVSAAIERHQELSATDSAEPTAPHVHVVSDLAAGSRVSGLASVSWPTGLELKLEPIEAAATANLSLQWLGWGVSTEASANPPARVRLLASPDHPTTTATLTVRDASTDALVGEPVTQVLSRGGTATVLLPIPADAPVALSLQLEGDTVSFDNRLWVIRPTPRPLPFVILGDAARNSPDHAAYYLTRAIAGWQDPLPELAPSWPLASAPDDCALPPLVIIPDAPASLDATLLRAAVTQGASVLLLVNDAPTAELTATLIGDPAWVFAPAPPTTGTNYALFGQIDFTHPLFLPFADPRYSDFSRIRFWSRPQLTLPTETNAHVAARFDDGSPAVLEAPVGRGRVVVWAGAWAPTDSQWVLSSKFVPWLQALAERTAGGPLRASVTDLDQLDRLGAFDALSSPPDHPGVYQLRRDGLPDREVALNVPTSESDLALLDLDTLTRLGAPLSAPADPAELAHREENRRDEAAYLTESRQKLWRWLLAAAAVLLVTESLLSLRIAQRAAAGT